MLLACEVDVDSVLAANIGNLIVRAKLTSVDDSEVWASCEVLLDLLLWSSLQHLFHEQSVVWLGTNDSCL